jgi:protein-S-isoprenylcysteine O-methyltransferase Ste14
MNELSEHFGQWGAVIFFIIIYGGALLFIPFYKKMDKKPAGTYLAFVIAFAIEMHGIPFSMLLIGSILGRYLPEGVLWGHTFISDIGYLGLYLNIILAVGGLIMIILGWYQIYHGYWKKVDGSQTIVDSGIYHYIRHPQYVGLMLIAIGMVFGWATLTNLIMLPILGILYYRLSVKEEKMMIEEFGDAYIAYMKKTKRFIPFVY